MYKELFLTVSIVCCGFSQIFCQELKEKTNDELIGELKNEAIGIERKVEALKELYEKFPTSEIIKTAYEAVENDYEQIKKTNKFYEETILVSQVDPEFYEICKQVVKRMGIEEEVVFKFYDTDDKKYKEEIAHYRAQDKTIYLNKRKYDERIQSKQYSLILGTVAHELEHYRQSNNYLGSYHGSDSILRETGADAAMAGFFDCLNCLLQRQDQSDLYNVERGYFNPEDYADYVARLEEDKNHCDACIKMDQGIDFQLSDCLSFEMYKNIKMPHFF
jgi:hypothetical protein